MAKHEAEEGKQQSSEDSSATICDLNRSSSAVENLCSKIVPYDPAQAYMQSNKWLLHDAKSARWPYWMLKLSDIDFVRPCPGLNFNCRYCWQLFERSESVTEHILAVHIPIEAQLGCGCCGKSFEFVQEAIVCLQGHAQQVAAEVAEPAGIGQ